MKGLQILTIGELNAKIRYFLESNIGLQSVWVRGELSNFVHHSSGHMYFTLKDEDGRMKSIMFAGNNRYIRFIPKNGMKVLAHGYVSMYEKDGQVQFYVQEMQPDGLGNLFLAFEQLKQKLNDEGLFDITVKKKLPAYPTKIGIVTSSSGAAVRDIITTLGRRYPLADVLLYPALVQGEEAPRSIVKGIEWFNDNRSVDVIIVGRGGGSLEELWAFNEEIVARAIFASHLPIVSAVGHETDFTIADFVADVRAATPTAAAELLTPHIRDIREHIERSKMTITKTMQRKIQIAKDKLHRFQKSQVLKRPRNSIMPHEQKLGLLSDKLKSFMKRTVSVNREVLNKDKLSLVKQSPVHKVALIRQRKEQLYKSFISLGKGLVQNKRKDWVLQIRQLDALSPLKVMQRGYSLVYSEKETLIKSIHDVELGDVIEIKLSDGTLGCNVWEMEESNQNGKAGTNINV